MDKASLFLGFKATLTALLALALILWVQAPPICTADADLAKASFDLIKAKDSSLFRLQAKLDTQSDQARQAFLVAQEALDAEKKRVAAGCLNPKHTKEK